jgi:hypothetical protein
VPSMRDSITINEVIEYAGRLNRVYVYYFCDKYEIDRSLFHANENGWSQCNLLETKCSITVKLLQYLLSIKSTIPTDELTSSCIVEIIGDNSDPSHTFIYLDGVVYHSYAMKYTLSTYEIDKDRLWKCLQHFVSNPNTEDWKKITGVSEKDFPNKYEVLVYHFQPCINNNRTFLTMALDLLNNAISAIQGQELKKHLYDNHTYILSFNESLIEKGLKFLCDTKSDLITLHQHNNNST